MRYGSGLWAFAVIQTLVSALAVPHAPVKRQTDSGNSFLELDPSNAKATFSVPCAGCGLGQAAADDAESLTFEFQAFLSEHPCGASNATLNGQFLAQNWDGIHAHGQGSVPTLAHPQQPASNPNSDLDLHLSWQTSCLFNGPPTEQAFSLGEDVAQVLTVTVNRIGDRELPGTHGFTISYHPFTYPELLRLSPIPVHDAAHPNTSEDWRNPPTILRITQPASDDELSLQSHIDELRRLEQEADLIHERIREQKNIIKSHFDQEHPSLREEIDHCDTFACVLSAIAQKARGAFRLVYLKISPAHHHRHDHHEMATADASRFAHRPGGQAAPFNVPAMAKFAQSDEKGSKASMLAQAEPPRSHPQPSPLVLAVEILAGILGLSGLLALLRRLCSPRRRAERQAAREERNRAREYHRSARRHRFRSFFTRRPGREQTQLDIEEKRSLVNEQEGILEAAMQEEIRQLRNAHEVVESLVHAEEGRVSASYSRTQHQRIAPMPLARVDSLPDYGSDSGMSDPPEYQTDDDDSDVVVDGFREYIPSTNIWTPGSSIPDVSPRESGETIRSIYMRV